MRAANITTAIAVSLWFGLTLIGRGLVENVALRSGGNVNMTQYSYYVFWPFFVVAGLLVCAWVINALKLWYWLLTILAGVALLALSLFLFTYSGGV
jgi:hypothetical protein